MTEKDFWNIVADSRREFDPHLRDGNMAAQVRRLHARLSALPDSELRSFGALLAKFRIRAYRWNLRGAAYLIGQGCSDDSFSDFRMWLISMGRRVYEAALQDPDSLARPAASPGVEVCFFEEFGYVDSGIMEERGLEARVRRHPHRLKGRRWKDEDLPRLYPKLWRRFGWRRGPTSGCS
jgi:hypothetical protein